MIGPYRLKLLAVAFLLSASSTFVRAQQSAPPAQRRVAIRAGRLIDCKSDVPISNALVIIEGDKILSVTPGGSPPPGCRRAGEPYDCRLGRHVATDADLSLRMVAPAATQPDLCQAEPHARGTRPKRQRLSSHSGGLANAQTLSQMLCLIEGSG